MKYNEPIPVVFDKKRRVQWSNAAVYRLGLIKLKPDGGYSSLVAMLWAALVPDDAQAFPTPEHLSRFIPYDDAAKIEQFSEILSRVLKSEDDPKNADGSTPRPSPASS